MMRTSLVQESIKDREILEEVFGTTVPGMSYPSGSYNEEVIDTLKQRKTSSANGSGTATSALKCPRSCNEIIKDFYKGE